MCREYMYESVGTRGTDNVATGTNEIVGTPLQHAATCTFTGRYRAYLHVPVAI